VGHILVRAAIWRTSAPRSAPGPLPRFPGALRAGPVSGSFGPFRSARSASPQAALRALPVLAACPARRSARRPWSWARRGAFVPLLPLCLSLPTLRCRDKGYPCGNAANPDTPGA
jgi:hypothetical protein